MPSKLILHSHYINQIIADHICPCHYVTWNKETLQWHMEDKSWTRMWPYYTVLLINFVNTFVFILTFAYIRWNPLADHSIDVSKQLVMCSFVLLITILVSIVDWLFITSGQEWVNAINWVYSTQLEFERKVCYDFSPLKEKSKRLIKSYSNMLTSLIAGKLRTQ